MRLMGVSAPRFTLGASLVFAAVAIFVLRPAVALAHHVDLAYTTTCDSYAVEADYIGGDEARYASVYVDGVLVQTANFPAGTELADNFFTLTGSLPISTTIEVRMYRPQPGPDALEDVDVVTINAAMSCTSTSTPQTTVTATATTVPDTATPTATVTSTSTSTQVPSATPTVHTQGSITPLPTDTPSTSTSTPSAPTSSATLERSTSTPDATLTPDEAGGPTATPTLITTVEALHPPKSADGPETGDEPPLETASGLPTTGVGAHGPRGILLGLTAAALAGIGLAITASGLRKVRD